MMPAYSVDRWKEKIVRYRRQRFRKAWTKDKDFRPWLREAEDKYKARCAWCRKLITASLTALGRHAKTNKHLLLATKNGQHLPDATSQSNMQSENVQATSSCNVTPMNGAQPTNAQTPSLFNLTPVRGPQSGSTQGPSLYSVTPVSKTSSTNAQAPLLFNLTPVSGSQSKTFQTPLTIFIDSTNLCIPDSLLPSLRCCRCAGYLSFAPVNVTQDGGYLCGKCVDETVEFTVRCHAYESLASMFMFPCQYKSQGCNAQIKFNKHSEHENECAFRTYSCPVGILATCNSNFTTLQLWEHYRQEHPDLFVEVPKFELEIEHDYEVLILTKVSNNFLFLLQTKCLSSLGKLQFSTIYLGSASNAALINCRIQLSAEQGGKERVLKLEEHKPSVFEQEDAEVMDVDLVAVTTFLRVESRIKCEWLITVPNKISVQSIKTNSGVISAFDSNCQVRVIKSCGQATNNTSKS